MTPASWSRVETLYHAALERERGERDVFLKQACAGDAALLREVVSLLEADEATERFLEQPAAAVATQEISGGAAHSWLGRRIRDYEVLSLIGAGGMGEVYRARDARLGRDVAFKVLPGDLAEDPERAARFDREARCLAALNHPNVAAVYGLEPAEGRQLLVMELVEGETLAERIARGPVPISEALALFRQLAAGLEAAHEKGIVHRDLKPANVAVTPQGRVKVLDFGLAKAFEGPASERGGKHPEGPSGAETSAGRLLGTVAYMSPEQARGQAVDRRTDVWAFGCVLYEALTGRRAFAGETLSDTLAAVLEREVEWAALPAGTPGLLRSLLRRCLEKDRDRRLHDIADARIEIEEILTELSGTPVPPRGETGPDGPGRRRWAFVIVAGALLLAGLVGAAWVLRPGPSGERPVRRFAFTPPDLQSAAISPDGRHIAYVAGIRPDTKLWIQDLDQEQPRALDGTEGARESFWSPNSEAIGFFVDWELKRVPATGGAVLTLCRLPGLQPGLGGGVSGAWSPEGTSIIFSSGAPSQLYEVSARGGAPKLLFDATGLEETRDPHFLPRPVARRTLLLRIGDLTPDVHEIAVHDLDTGERRVLVSGREPVYSPSGHVLYQPSYYGALYALPFSLRAPAPASEAFPVAEHVRGFPSVSRDGTLVYVEALPAQAQLALRDRSGRTLGVAGLRQDRILLVRASPDGSRVAASGITRGAWDVWVHEVARPTATRLTYGEYPRTRWPTWSARGDRIAFSAVSEGVPNPCGDILVKPVGAGGEVEGLVTGPLSDCVEDWSPDGRYVVYSVHDPQSLDQDIWYVDLGRGEDPPQPAPFVQLPEVQHLAKFSPDGRFVAYLSRESGRSEIYVERFPEGGDRVQVSSGGACQMRWGRNGEIFYVELAPEDAEGPPQFAPPRDAGTLVAIPVATVPELLVGRPHRLFTSVGLTGNYSGKYDVFADGERFVISEPIEEPSPATIRVIENWFEAFRDRPAPE